MRRGVKLIVLLAALMVAVGGTPSFAETGIVSRLEKREEEEL